MRTTTITCDVCAKKCEQEFSVYTGSIVKMTDGQLRRMGFEGHYCGDCTGVILSFVDKFKKEKNG